MLKTLNNLIKAYVGETLARNKYTLFSKIAKKEGFEYISKIFLITAENELEHAKWFLKMAESLNKDKIDININLSFSLKTKNTLEALKEAIEGEKFEYTNLYPKFAQIAREEGFEEIAKRIDAIAFAENHHKERFEKLYDLLKENKFFKRDKKIKWVCLKCGYVHESEEAPQVCPSCSHPQGYFAPSDLNIVY